MSVAKVLPLAALALFAGCAKNYYSSAAEWGSPQSTRVAAAESNDIGRVRVESRQGPIRFEGSDSAGIVVTLKVGHARGKMGTTRTCPVAANPPAIRSTRASNELRVDVERDLPDDCVAEWTIAMPRRMVAEARVVAGDVTVNGTNGGAVIQVTTGNVRVGVSGGQVTAETNVGDVEVNYGSESYGSMSAKSNVGDITLWINGRKLEHRGAPGSGDALQLAGSGSAGAPVRATVNVGDIRIRLGTP